MLCGLLMSSILTVGVILLVGFVGGELAKKLRLPKVTGFILAGIFLNPNLTGFISKDFTTHTDMVISISLAFIAFSVGGTLSYKKVQRSGKQILYITLFEAESAFLVTALGMALVWPLFVHTNNSGMMTVFISGGLLMGCLACPTDPSATLAVVHEYKAKGPVSSTIMGVAALDDALGIINFSLAVALGRAIMKHQQLSMFSGFVVPVYSILGAVVLGAVFGLVLNLLTYWLDRETEGALIVAILAMLSLCAGLSILLGVDQLLANMTTGVVVINFNPKREKIFNILQRYTEELVFVLFFTLSGMHLDVGVLWANVGLVLFFVAFRTFGKILGAVTGAVLSKASVKVKKHVWPGLIPQGGIVVGLALLIKQDTAFAAVSDIVINVVIGATVIHEIIGPILSKLTIRSAGESHD